MVQLTLGIIIKMYQNFCVSSLNFYIQFNKYLLFNFIIRYSTPIIRLDNFQSQWTEVGRMKSAVRLKFTAVKSLNEVFIYGGKCEKLGKKKRKSGTHEACKPMAEVFNFSTGKSKGVKFDIPGNLEAAALIYKNFYNTSDFIDDHLAEDDRKNNDDIPRISARSFVDNDLAAEFADFFNDLEEEEEIDPQLLNDFADFTGADDAELGFDYMTEEEEENLKAFENLDLEKIESDENSVEVSLLSTLDTDKDGEEEISMIDFFPRSFQLPLGNFSVIVDSLVRRNKDEIVEARSNSMQCWKCDGKRLVKNKFSNKSDRSDFYGFCFKLYDFGLNEISF